MNTRFRRPLQAVALLFSLTLFIGYLWLTQRQSGLPSIEAFPQANDSPSDPFLNPSTVQNTAALTSIEPPTGSEFEDFMDGKIRLPDGRVTSFFMPGSKNISQPVFSTRKVAQPVNPPAPAPLMPSSKRGIFALPHFSFDPSIHNRSLMSGSKSGRVYNFFSTLWHNSPSSPNTITSGSPTDQIHLIQPTSPLPGAVSSGALEIPTP